jgi:hypothetical protein
MGGSSTHTEESRLAGVQIQTALLGQAIPMGWGRGRLSCNLVDYVAFTPIPHTTKTSSGGKGGGSSTNTTYSYTASVVMALCEGPITSIASVYKDTSVYSSLSAAGLSLATGTSSQAPWSYLTSLFPTHALSYPTIAYVYAQGYDLSSSASLANHSFEINFGVQLTGAAGGDADPKDIVTDFLTNADHGVTGWTSGLLADLSNYSLYCRANNLLLSPVLDQQAAASDLIKQVMAETNSDCFWSEGLLKIKPFGDASATANSVTWTPSLAPVFDLDEDSLIEEVQLEIVDQSDAYNYVQVEFLDRSNQYQAAIAPANDLDNIVTYGLRKQDPQQLHHICDAGIAKHVAQIWLQRNLYIRDRYHFSLPMDFIGLEPMDYVTLTTTVDGMTLNRQLVMIESIDEDEDGQDTLHLVAEGIPGSTASAALYPAHTATGFQPAVTADPGNVATPVLFNAPTSLAPNGYEAWAAVAGANSAWGGCNVWVSFDGTNYAQVGTVNSPARYGILSAVLGNVADPDSTSTLGVDLTTSLGALGTATNAEADAGGTLCLVDNELLAFGTATLTAANKYNLSYLRRGQRGTAVASHAIGGQFVRLDDAIFKFAYNPANSGATVRIKFQSFNVYGRALQDLASLSYYSLALTPATSLPAQPTGLGIAGGGSAWTGSSLNLVCMPSVRATSYRFDIYKADGTTLVRSITNVTPNASYAAADALLDGALRTYNVAVTAINAAGLSPVTAQIVVTNVAPAAVGSPTATGGTTTGAIACTATSDTDSAGYIVFYSPTTGFNPSTTGAIKVSGTNSISIYSLAAGTYYCKFACYDAWSRDPSLLNLSAEMSFVISTGGGTAPATGGGFREYCVEDSTPILMADGGEVPAQDLRVGDMLRTRHEHTLEWGDFPITAISFEVREVFAAKGYPRATARHRFWIDGEWARAEDIGQPDGTARVAKITVDDAHTYISAGVLSHNVKP